MAILLATHNGARFLSEQLRSHLAQRDVDVRIIVSDDRSTDATLSMLRDAEGRAELRLLAPATVPLGNANCNFMRLIHDSDVMDADFVAFSDQDDLWHSDKLQRATEMLRRNGADGYSGNVTAFWPDGRRVLLEKAQPQKPFDHLFESAGPGCSFVLTRRAFDLAQGWVRADYAQARALRIHDWAIYALLRHNGMKWYIDSRSTLDYRQHSHNELGANVGYKAAWSRLRQLRDGRFRNEIVGLCEAIREDGEIARRLRRLSILDRLGLALRASSCRRRSVDALMLALFFLITRKLPR